MTRGADGDAATVGDDGSADVSTEKSGMSQAAGVASPHARRVMTGATAAPTSRVVGGASLGLPYQDAAPFPFRPPSSMRRSTLPRFLRTLLLAVSLAGGFSSVPIHSASAQHLKTIDENGRLTNEEQAFGEASTRGLAATIKKSLVCTGAVKEAGSMFFRLAALLCICFMVKNLYGAAQNSGGSFKVALIWMFLGAFLMVPQRTLTMMGVKWVYTSSIFNAGC